MLLRWSSFAPTNAFKTALWMWRVKSLMCISPMVLWWNMTFHVTQKSIKFESTRNSTAFYEDNIKWRTWTTFKITFKRRTTYPRYVVRMLNWFDMLSSYGKNTKHCKTRWTMTFFKIANNELELRSGEPQASSCIYIYTYTHTHPTLYIKTHVYVHVYVHVHVCIYMYIY